MGWPVVTVASGGIAVTDASATGYGIPVNEAVNGMGTAVTYVASGGLAVLGGSSSTRILIAGYGQSNMDQFFTGGGLAAMSSALTTATGLPVVSVDGANTGADISNLVKGTPAYINFIALVNGVSGYNSKDQVLIIWDHGEGDANAAPATSEITYIAKLSQLYSDIVADIGRTKINTPFINSSKGTTNVAAGTINGGTTPLSWHNVQNALTNAALRDPKIIYSCSDIDLVRSDSYHYVNTTGMGQRFAQGALVFLGKQTKLPPWYVSSAAVVDATHTNINLTHSMGTDFTPTSGVTGFEVSGDNGVTWSTPSAAVRNSATQIGLTHASLFQGNPRLIRYCYGMLPPDAAGFNPPTALVKDNGTINSPLNPTTWDIRSSGGTTLPVPTYRGSGGMVGSSVTQTFVGMPLGPSFGGQRFVILGMAGPDTSFITSATVTITPTDYQGNAVGTPVVTTTTAALGPTGNPGLRLMQAIMGADANAATLCNVSVAYNADPFNGSILHLWTVPLADMSSTTKTGSGTATGTGVGMVSRSATLNVSAGGFVIEMGAFRETTNGWGYGNPVSFTGSTEGYGDRYDFGSGIPGYVADAANCGANAASNVTVTYSGTNPGGNVTTTNNLINLLAVAWR